MSLNVIEKYVEKKKKDLFEYAKILEEIIKVENNTLWKNKEEFKGLTKGIIEEYANIYYFENNVNRNNPIKYSNDNINNVLQSMIKYCQKYNSLNILKINKNETFLLSVIICSACYLDFACNVVDGNYVDTKNKFKYLLNYLKKTNILKVYANDKVNINALFEQIKRNIKEDEKAFLYYVDDNGRYVLCTQVGSCERYTFDGLSSQGAVITTGSTVTMVDGTTYYYNSIQSENSSNEESSNNNSNASDIDVEDSATCGRLKEPLMFIGNIVLVVKIAIPIIIIALGFYE